MTSVGSTKSRSKECSLSQNLLPNGRGTGQTTPSKCAKLELSGSPVFVNVGPGGSITYNGRLPQRGLNTFYLLGLVHGHWGFPVPDTDSESELDATNDKKINSGIAMVVPATKIYETLQHPTLTETRQRIFDEEMRKRADDAVAD